MNISVNQLWHIVTSYFFALKLKFKLSKDWCWTKPQYTLETWLWDAEAVSPKDRRKPRLDGVALSQQGGGNFRALNVWFSFVPRGGWWGNTGVSRTTCLWVNMLHSEPQADTQSQIFSKRYPTWFQRLSASGKGSLPSTQAATGNSKCPFLECLRFSSFYRGSIEQPGMPNLGHSRS